MVQCILDSGNLDKDMVEGNNYGKTGAYMRASGKIIWQMEKDV